MINFKSKIAEIESLEKRYNDLNDQYEKDKLEIYSILVLKIKTLKRSILRKNVSNYESFNYIMEYVLKDSSISTESMVKLYDDEDIINLLFKNGIMKRESFVSFVFLINSIYAVLLSSSLSFIMVYLTMKEFSVEVFGIHFIIITFILISLLCLNGSFFKFKYFHFIKKEH